MSTINTGATCAARVDRVGDPALLDVKQVATILRCSVRHVRRLADAGRMPLALRLGGIIRWDRAAIEAWISEGCPSMRRKSAPHVPSHR